MISSVFSRELRAFLVRDRVAQILADEEQNQRRLVAESGGNPDPYRVRIYRERIAPWSQWLDAGNSNDLSPVASVMLLDERMVSGNVISRQRGTVTLAIDCAAVGVARNAADGFQHAESESLVALQSAVGFVYGAVMAGENTYLGLDGIVGKRWIDSLVSLALDVDAPQASPHVRACRITLLVDAAEITPQIEPVDLASVSLQLTRDGQVLAGIVVPVEE